MASLIDKAKEFVAEKIANIPKPEATLTKVSVKSFNRSSATFHSEVTVTNPYNNALPICEISYTLKSADRLVVHACVFLFTFSFYAVILIIIRS